MATRSMKCVRLPNHPKLITQMFADSFASKLFSDVTICCGGQNFQAHKLVLSMSSPYFKTIFEQDQADHPIVYLSDVSPEAVQLILEYCYKGAILIHQNKLHGFFKGCKFLQIGSLFNDDESMDESNASVISDTDEEANIISNNSTKRANNKNTIEKSAKTRIQLPKSPILIEDDSNEAPSTQNGITTNGSLECHSALGLIREISTLTEPQQPEKSPSSSHLLIDATQDNLSLHLNNSRQCSIMESPPLSTSTIRRKNKKRLSVEIPENVGDKSPLLSSPESFVFNLKSSPPIFTETQTESVVFLTQRSEILEISSDEDEILPKINQDNLNVRSLSGADGNLSKSNQEIFNVSSSEEMLLVGDGIVENPSTNKNLNKRSINEVDTDSDDSEINIRKFTKPVKSLKASDDSEINIEKSTKPAKNLRVILTRMPLEGCRSDTDSLAAQNGSATQISSDVTLPKDSDNSDVSEVCQKCQRCVRPQDMKRHALKHKMMG